MTTPELSVGSVAAYTAGEIERHSDKFGLTWQKRPGTVIAGTTSTSMRALVQVDGDPPGAGIPVISVVGALIAGQRVMTTSVPPEGVYVTGLQTTLAGFAGVDLADQSTYFTPGTQTRTSVQTAFVNIVDNVGAALTLTFTKALANTRLLLDTRYTVYANPAPGTVEFGVSIDSVDYATVFYFINAVEHEGVSRIQHLAAGIAAGSKTVTMRWRNTGSGTITLDTNDRINIRIQEVI